MSTRFWIKSWRKSRNDKNYTANLGTGWTDDKGVIRCDLDALPIPDDKGRVTFFLEVQKDRDEQPRQGNRPAARDEDSIPFAPEVR